MSLGKVLGDINPVAKGLLIYLILLAASVGAMIIIPLVALMIHTLDTSASTTQLIVLMTNGSIVFFVLLTFIPMFAFIVGATLAWAVGGPLITPILEIIMNVFFGELIVTQMLKGTWEYIAFDSFSPAEIAVFVNAMINGFINVLGALQGFLLSVSGVG
jgi:hypothetical protein